MGRLAAAIGLINRTGTLHALTRAVVLAARSLSRLTDATDHAHESRVDT